MTIISRPSIHGSYIDLQKNELRNAVIQVLAADPGSPVEGQVYFNSTSDRFRLYANGSWEELATLDDVTAGGISVALFDAKGDLLVGTGSGAVDNLGVGANDTVLTADSSTATGLKWAAPAATYTDEMARDAIGTALVAGNNIDITVNDAGDTITVDVEGLTSADVSDFNEAAQDAVGTIFVDSSEIDFTYADATPSITGSLINGSVALTRLATQAANTILGNNTGGAASPTALTASQVKTLLALTEADITLSTTDVLVGRDTASGGAAEEITVGGGIEFTGSGGIQRSALTGDITAAAGSNTTAIAAGVIVNADVNASAGIVVTKLASSATDRLFGRDTASAGAGEEITVGGGIEFTGSGGIQTSALTGDITKAAGSTTTAIGAGVIVDADVNASAAIAATKLAFTPAQGIAATNVQAAIEEVVTDLSASITAATEGKAWKDPVRVATTANDTLSGLAARNGVTPVAGDRILVGSQTTTADNGIYVAAAGAWSRAADANTAAELTSATVLIREGTGSGGNWGPGDIYTFPTITTLGTTNATPVKTGEGNTVYTADESSITLSGTQFAVKAAGVTATHLAAAVAGNGLTGGAGTALAVGAGTGLTVAADSIGITAGGVGVTELATAVAGNGLTGGGGTALAVGAGTGLTVAADSIGITAGGVTETQLATSVAGNGLTGGGGTALAVGAGTGITVNANDIAITAGGVTATQLATSVAGNGLTGGGGTALAVGAGTGISVAADAISIDTSVVVTKYATTIGNGSLTTFTITHNLNTRDVTWSCYDVTTFEEYIPEVAHTTVNTLTATFSGMTPSASQLRFVVQA